MFANEHVKPKNKNIYKISIKLFFFLYSKKNNGSLFNEYNEIV